MTTAELKASIRTKIEKIEDSKLLESINEVLDNNLYQGFVLEPWQIKQIEESEEQVKRGLVISKEEADKKIEEWLKK